MILITISSLFKKTIFERLLPKHQVQAFNGIEYQKRIDHSSNINKQKNGCRSRFVFSITLGLGVLKLKAKAVLNGATFAQ